MRILYLLIICISLQGCAALEAVKLLGGGTSADSSINTEANVGSDVQKGVTNTQNTSNQEIQSNSGNAGNVVDDRDTQAGVINNFDPMYLVIIIIGSILTGIVFGNLIPTRRQNKVFDRLIDKVL